MYKRVLFGARTFLVALSLLLSFSSPAVENYPHHHHHSHDHARHNHFQQGGPMKTYSCDLIDYSNQCRQYEILESANDKVEELTDGCSSMGGSFTAEQCPHDKELLAECVDIVRNYHKPDVIYSNFYYAGSPSNWDKGTLDRVCGDLGGEFVAD